MAHDYDNNDNEPLESGEAEIQSRRSFLIGLGKWSGVVVGAAILGNLIDSDDDVHAQRRRGGGSWVNRRGGGGGAWVNRSGGGGGWINRSGGGWVNRGGSWVNRGGGSWVNRRGGGGWINRR